MQTFSEHFMGNMTDNSSQHLAVVSGQTELSLQAHLTSRATSRVRYSILQLHLLRVK